MWGWDEPAMGGANTTTQQGRMAQNSAYERHFRGGDGFRMNERGGANRCKEGVEGRACNVADAAGDAARAPAPLLASTAAAEPLGHHRVFRVG